MRQLRWGLKAEFPYTKVFILGVLLTVLGSACVVVSVIGIVKLAWGYYVSTGMWGGLTVTMSGLAAMYSSRVQTSKSARLYFALSVVTCCVSFAMIVLSAGGLTYKSNFYEAVKFDRSRHQATLFLHSSVLGVGVLSLACNVLSVIVCCKFMTRDKTRGVESLKLRRQRHRFSDPNTVYITGSLRGGSGGPIRSSTSSRTPLFGSDRSHGKHSRQPSDGEFSTTNLKIPSERSSHRRDSERSRGSSRSRHSHHRQSSSVSQQSRLSGPIEPEVTTLLLRDSGQVPNSLSGGQSGMSSRSAAVNARDSETDTLTDNASVQLVFDPDEEPLPPYEERPSNGNLIRSNADEETETVNGSSSVVIPSYLPLNIPVTHLVGGPVGGVVCQTQSLQRQPPPSRATNGNSGGVVCQTQSLQRQPPPSRTATNGNPPPSSRRGRSDENVSATMNRTASVPSSPAINHDMRDIENCINLMRMSLTEGRQAAEPQAEPDPETPEDRVASPEICALTGARMTPVAEIQPDVVGTGVSTLTSCVQPSPGSSDTSIPGAVMFARHPASFRSQSGPATHYSRNSPSALPTGIRSPNSAFRPVGRRVGPLSHASPSHSVPLHNFFSPIGGAPGAALGSAHHTVYSPVASPKSNPQMASCPTSPRHASALSSESLTRGASSAQSLSWKKIPLPTSHNHSNKTSSVPTKEVISKNIPGPAEPVSRDPERDHHDIRSQQFLPRQSSKELAAAPAPMKSDMKSSSRFATVPSSSSSPRRNPAPQFSTLPARTPQEAPPQSSPNRQRPSRRSSDSNSTAINHSMSAFVGTQSSAFANHSSGNHPSAQQQQQQQQQQQHQQQQHQQQQQRPAVKNANSGEQMTEIDSVRRSAGCQATEDGGISSSMDRTTRWVLGTLPSGTRFQGTTRNTALLHSTSSSATRAAVHVTGNRHGGGGRSHGVWDRPSASTALVPTSVSSPIVASSQPVPQSFRPVPSSQPLVPEPVTAKSAFTSSQPLIPQPAKTMMSSSQPLIPQPVRPVPASSHHQHNKVGNSSQHQQPVMPQPIRPVPTSKPSAVTSSQPVVPQPIRPVPTSQSSFRAVAPSQPNQSSPFKAVVPSQPMASQPLQPVPTSLSSFKAVPPSQPIAPKPIRPDPNAQPAKVVAPSKPVAPQPIRPVVSSAQPQAPQPTKMVNSAQAVVGSSGGSFSPVLKGSSRLPRYQPAVHQPQAKEEAPSQPQPQPGSQTCHQPQQQPAQPPPRAHPRPLPRQQPPARQQQQPQPSLLAQQPRQQPVQMQLSHEQQEALQELVDGDPDFDQQQSKPLFSMLL